MRRLACLTGFFLRVAFKRCFAWTRFEDDQREGNLGATLLTTTKLSMNTLSDRGLQDAASVPRLGREVQELHDVASAAPMYESILQGARKKSNLYQRMIVLKTAGGAGFYVGT